MQKGEQNPSLYDFLLGYCDVYALHLTLVALFCRWASLADAHGDKLAAIDPHQSPATKLTYLCVRWGLLAVLAVLVFTCLDVKIVFGLLSQSIELMPRTLCRELESQIIQFAAGLQSLSLKAGEKVSADACLTRSMLMECMHYPSERLKYQGRCQSLDRGRVVIPHTPAAGGTPDTSHACCRWHSLARTRLAGWWQTRQ